MSDSKEETTKITSVQKNRGDQGSQTNGCGQESSSNK